LNNFYIKLWYYWKKN